MILFGHSITAKACRKYTINKIPALLSDELFTEAAATKHHNYQARIQGAAWIPSH